MSIEYEHLSGDYLLAYWNQTAGKLAYRTYSGSSISGESTLSLPASSRIRYVSLVQKLESNEMMLLALNDNATLYAVVWNGITFGSVTTLSTSLKSDGYECFAGVYESLSGDFLVAYAESGQSSPRYRTYTNGSWSAQATMPSVGATMNFIRLSCNPVSDEVIFAALDTANDINVNNWNGSAWSSDQELETDVGLNNRRVYDLAYLGGGSAAVIIYREGTSGIPRFRYWYGSWSGENTAMDLVERPGVIAGTTSQTAGQVYFAMTDEGSDLTIAWSSTMSFATPETSVGGSISTEPFMIATPGPVPPSPANTPYANDFQSTVGAEWTYTTTSSTSTHTKFLGRFRSEQVNLFLNTVAGRTYTCVFDLYTIDSWDGTPGPYGPDNFSVSVNNSQVFSKTFAHDPTLMTGGYSYPYPADQYGDYGFNSSHKDGIFRKVEVAFRATGDLTRLMFTGNLKDESNIGFNDESWGIDNISVNTATFVDVTSAAGVAVATTSSEQDGSGLHWADLDQDGDVDAIVTGGSSSRLLLNNLAAGTFSVSTFGGGAAREQGGLADFDQDGDLDFWSCEVGSDGVQALFVNDGSAVFSNVGTVGFSGTDTNEGCAAADTNRDGWPDVVVFGELANWIGVNQKSGSASFLATKSSSATLNGYGNYGARGYCSTGDINNDGYLDFFYRYNGGRLFISNGDGTYTQNGHGISVLTGGYEDTASVLADYDNDGDLDLFVPRTTAGYTGALWRNDVNWTSGLGNFTDVSLSKGLTLNGKPSPSGNTGTRSGCWGDYDNDGDLDLFIVGSNGNCMLYRNDGGGTLTRTGEGAVVSGSGLDAVFVDYDNDGDLDLAVTTSKSNLVLFQNQTNSQNYLKVRLVGRGDGGTNTTGQGIRVELWNAAGTILLARRDIGTARGYGGAVPMWAHFGGVNPATTYMLKVYFDGLPVATPFTVTVVPSEASTTIGATTIPQMISIEEPTGKHKILYWSEIRRS